MNENSPFALFLHADPNDADAALADEENIAHRLQKDVSEQSGKLHIFLSNRLQIDQPPQKLTLSGGHRGPLTAAVASNNGRYIYTASKDGRVVRWRMSDGRVDMIVPRRGAGSGDAGVAAPVVNGVTSVVDVEMDDGGAEASTSAATASSSSKSSGASRRKARRQAALTAAATTDKGKGKAVEGSEAENISVGQDEGHEGEILSLAISSDGKYLVTGGRDRRVGVWALSTDDATASSARWVKGLVGHKDAISGVKFKAGSHELYTASLDRTLKIFDVDQLSYIETLFGHQESIHSLDALKGDFAVTAGGRDRTARWWKVRDESQLVFRGGAKSKMRDVIEGGDLLQGDDNKKIRGDRGGSIIEGSLDAVTMIDDQHFLTGGDSGAISLWSLGKKKPIFSRAATHGFDTRGEDGDLLQPRWVTSLACLPYGDVFASGSWDGYIRLWALDSRLRSFKPLMKIRIDGVVNSLQLLQPPRSSLQTPVVKPELWRGAKSTDKPPAQDQPVVNGTRPGKEAVPPILIAAIGSEPRLGRWMRMKKARSGGLVVPLKLKQQQQRVMEE